MWVSRTGVDDLDIEYCSNVYNVHCTLRSKPSSHHSHINELHSMLAHCYCYQSIQLSHSQTQWNLFLFLNAALKYNLSQTYGLGSKSLNCSQRVICHMLCVMCHVPLVRCQVSYVTFYIYFLFFLDTLVKLVNGGSVISGVTLFSLHIHGHSRPHWELTDKKEVYVFNKLCLFFWGGG